MTQLLDLQARQHSSKVLARFLAEDPARAQRAGMSAPQAGVVRNADSGQFTQWGGQDWSEWMRGGVAVNERVARCISAVVACTSLIGGSIASLPLHFYRRTTEGRERVSAGYAERMWWLFNERPHPEWSAAAFWGYLADSRLLHGDAFARIQRAGRYGDEPTGFAPWHPDFVDVDLVDGRLLYTFWPMHDELGAPEVVEADDVLHISGPGFNGRRSLSQLRFALKHPAGIAYAADEQAAAFMADGARPDFAIEVTGTVNPQQQDDIRRRWLDRHSGQGSKKAPVILSNGMKLHQLTMSMEDAQLLTTRSFQVEEVCRIFGVPPHMVGHTDKATSWGSGIEQQNMGFVTYTLQRHLVAFEQEINHKLFRTARLFGEFLTAGLLRGDTKSRFEAYRIALGRAGEPAWMRPNEVRKLENLPPDEALNATAATAPAPAGATPPEPTP